MPSEIACMNCSLQFSVGWFHYHIFDSGYGSKTLLVCAACGTQHAIEDALRDRGPEHFNYCDVVLTAVSEPARILALELIRSTFGCTATEAKERLQTFPLHLKHRLSHYELKGWQQDHHTTGLSVEFPVVDTEANPDFGPIKSDRLLGARTPNTGKETIELQELPINTLLSYGDSINLSIQSCAGCSRIGTLTDEFNVAVRCPKCEQLTLQELSFWVT